MPSSSVVVWGNGEGGYNNSRPYIIKMEFSSIKGVIEVIDIQRHKEEERGKFNLTSQVIQQTSLAA